MKFLILLKFNIYILTHRETCENNVCLVKPSLYNIVYSKCKKHRINCVKTRITPKDKLMIFVDKSYFDIA